MDQIEIAVSARADRGKNAARRLRRAGQVPAVFYGHGEAAVSVQMAAADLWRMLRVAGHSTLLRLKSADKDLNEKFALIRDLRRDPVSDHFIHVDLQGVRLDEEVHVNVGIKFVGHSAGEKAGGVRDVHYWELDIACRADSIPHEISVDVSELEIGDVMHARDVALPAGARLRTDGAVAIIGVIEPQKIEEPAPAAAAATAEAAPAEGAAAAPAAAADKADKKEGGK